MMPDARERRFTRIREIGCLCCKQFGWFSLPDVHHLNLGGKAGQERRGDEYTIGICPWHHRGILKPPANVGPSLAHTSKAFRKVFGTDDELLERQNQLIAEREKRVVGA